MKSRKGAFMEDYRIVDLYWARNETAIQETETKYGRMLGNTSYSLLSSREDAQECVNDTYIAAWNRMPQERPVYLGAYLTRIVRNISIGRFRSAHREKRGGSPELIEELTECIPDNDSIDSQLENQRLAETVRRFVASLAEEKRAVFVRRYFWSQDISQIALETRLGESKVKTMLYRLRISLRELLEREKLL